MDITKYYSINVDLLVKRDTTQRVLFDEISKFMSLVMGSNIDLNELHKSRGFKHFSYSVPYIKNNNLKGITSFEIRSFKKDLIAMFVMALTGFETVWGKVITVNIKEENFTSKIQSIENITPAVCTISTNTLNRNNIKVKKQNTYWEEKHPLEIIKNSIAVNLSKKYKELTGEDIDFSNFIKDISVINNSYHIAYLSKSSTLIGNRFKIKIGAGLESQRLARVAVVNGLLEKNTTLGLGFIKPSYEVVK